jgi:hypothetical protein
MPNSLPDQVRPAGPLYRQSVPAHAGLASAHSLLIQRAGDDERRALGNALLVVERLARDLTGRRP